MRTLCRSRRTRTPFIQAILRNGRKWLGLTAMIAVGSLSSARADTGPCFEWETLHREPAER
jgi:hypothetical protein